MPGSRSLSPAGIGDRLRARFGDDILSVDDVHGHTVVGIGPARSVEVATFLRDEPDLAFDYFDFLSAVDRTPKDDGFDVITHLFSTCHNHDCRLRVAADIDTPGRPTS